MVFRLPLYVLKCCQFKILPRDNPLILRGNLIFPQLRIEPRGVRFDQNSIIGIDDPGYLIFFNRSRIFAWENGAPFGGQYCATVGSFIV